MRRVPARVSLTVVTDHPAPRRWQDLLSRQPLQWARGRSFSWAAPLLLLAGITTVDLNTTEGFRIISWIVLVPGIAAAICGVWTTAVFAVLSVFDYIAVDSAWPQQYQAGLPDFILVAFAGLLAILACVVRTSGERRMLHMRDIAETTRRTVLRPLTAGRPTRRRTRGRWGGPGAAAVGAGRSGAAFGWWG